MADVITILNTIRANSSALYQERIPEATQANLQDVGGALMQYEVLQNEFLGALINRIAFTIVSNKRYQNPLSILKKGTKPFGTDIQEIFTNPVEAVAFDGSNTSDMLEVKKPDVKTMYHRMNRQDKYRVSVSTPQLQKAFTNVGTMGSFIDSIITAMYSGDEMDEYLLMRNTISDAIANNKLISIDVTYDGGAETCKELVKMIKTISTNLTFPSRDYNAYNLMNKAGIDGKTITPCTTWTPKENQVFLIRGDVDAATDVEVLAKAFNMDKTDFLKRKIVVDSFGDANTLCGIVDEKMFQIYDDLYTVRSFDNGSNLTTNYWLHHWETVSLSLFANGVFLKQAA